MKIEYKENCCSFCDPETDEYLIKGVGKDEVTTTNFVGFIISTEGDDFNLVCDVDDNRFKLKINFCPVCGRSLKVVYKINDLEKDFENKEKENG